MDQVRLRLPRKATASRRRRRHPRRDLIERREHQVQMLMVKIKRSVSALARAQRSLATLRRAESKERSQQESTALPRNRRKVDASAL
jgi:hypothetical protein